MIKEDPSDGELIERYLNGDRSGIALLVKRWHRLFCSKAYWVLRDKDLAKDVAQESWVIIIERLSSLKKRDSFKSWGLRIVYTKAIDAHKKRVKELAEKNVSSLEFYEEPKETNGRRMLQKKLLTAIQGLTKDKQDIIRLFYVEDYSLKEIAVFLGIPVGTVKSRLFKSREKLKEIIKSKEHE